MVTFFFFFFSIYKTRSHNLSYILSPKKNPNPQIKKFGLHVASPQISKELQPTSVK